MFSATDIVGTVAFFNGSSGRPNTLNLSKWSRVGSRDQQKAQPVQRVAAQVVAAGAAAQIGVVDHRFHQHQHRLVCQAAGQACQPAQGIGQHITCGINDISTQYMPLIGKTGQITRHNKILMNTISAGNHTAFHPGFTVNWTFNNPRACVTNIAVGPPFKMGTTIYLGLYMYGDQ